MKPRTINVLYWVLTILFSAFMLFSAIGGMVMGGNGDNSSMKSLGYPSYFLMMLGVGKILGVIAILQTKFRTVKEWAFAGFTIDFIAAFWSMKAVGEGMGMLMAPVIALIIMFSCYALWKKGEQNRMV